MEKLQYYIKVFFKKDIDPLEALHSRAFIKWLLVYDYLRYCGFDAKIAGEKGGTTVREKEYNELDKRMILIDLLDDPIEFVESELLKPVYKEKIEQSVYDMEIQIYNLINDIGAES